MERLDESSELYQVTQLFYNAKYKDIIELGEDEFIFESPINAIYFKIYKIRSYLILDLIDEAQQLFTELESDDDSITELLSVLKSYISFKKSPTNSSEIFKLSESITEQSLDLSLYFIGLAYTQIGQVDQSIKFLSDRLSQINLDLIESINLLILNYLFIGDFKKSNELIKLIEPYNQDYLIINLVTSYNQMINEINYNYENINSFYYQFDELSTNESSTSFRNLVNLLIANLKLKRFPESLAIIDKITELGYFDSPTESKNLKTIYLINLLTYSVLDPKSDYNHQELFKQLQNLSPECNYMLDLNEKNVQFDNIVEKYKLK